MPMLALFPFIFLFYCVRDERRAGRSASLATAMISAMGNRVISPAFPHRIGKPTGW